MYYVYVLQSVDNEADFYLGFSANLKQRLKEHNAGRNPSTRGRSWHIVYYEAYLSEGVARARERKLKRNRRMNQLLMARIKAQFQSD